MKWTSGYVLIAVVYFLVFVFFLFLTLYVSDAANSSDLFFDGANTYSIFNDKLSFRISNDKNSPDTIVHVEARYGQTDLNISSLDLYEGNSKRTIDSNYILFNGRTSLLTDLSTATPKDIKVEINRNEPGLYHGSLRVTSPGQNMIFIPISIDIKPDFFKVAIWVIDGIVVAVAAWNLIGYRILKTKFSANIRKTDNFISGLSNEEIMSTSPSVENIVSKLERSKPNSAQRNYVRLRDSYPYSDDVRPVYANTVQMSADVVKMGPKWRNTRTGKDIQATDLKQLSEDWRARLQALKEREFSLRDNTTKSVIIKNIISGLTGVVFGLVIGFIPLLESVFITNLRDIGIWDILILVGLGIGIGNLNEAISKIWEKPGDEDDDENT